MPCVVAQSRRRTLGQQGVCWVSDGHGAYRQAVHRVYRDWFRTGKRERLRWVRTVGVGLTQAVKHRRDGRVVRVEVGSVLGEAVGCSYPVRVERWNGVLRDWLNCLMRRTQGFAERVSTWDALVGLCLWERNWLRAHWALRELCEGVGVRVRDGHRGSAMAVGLTDHLWSWEAFLTYRHYHYQME